MQGVVCTHVHQEAWLGEDRGGWTVAGDVSVELLPVPVPLDAVEPVALHVVAALQHHVLPEDGVGGEGGAGQADRGDGEQSWVMSQ